MALMMTRIWCLSLLSIAGMRPMRIDISSASMGVMFMVWARCWLVTELSDQAWATADAMLDFLTPPSAMMAVIGVTKVS